MRDEVSHDPPALDLALPRGDSVLGLLLLRPRLRQVLPRSVKQRVRMSNSRTIAKLARNLLAERDKSACFAMILCTQPASAASGREGGEEQGGEKKRGRGDEKIGWFACIFQSVAFSRETSQNGFGGR